MKRIFLILLLAVIPALANFGDEFDYSEQHPNLQSLAELMYSSLSFVKMTGTNTFALDTNTYVETAVNFSPIAINFGNNTQQYDIDGETWETSTDGTPNIAGHLLPAALLSIATPYDDSELKIRENTGVATATNPLTVQFTWTGIITFGEVEARIHYDGSASHTMVFEFYNGVDWDEFIHISDNPDFELFTAKVLVPATYIDSGTVIGRFRHEASGNTGHHLEIDYIVLSTGAGGGGGSVQTAIQTPSTAGTVISSTNVQGVIDEIDALLPATLGTAEADKLLSVDSNLDIDTIRNLGITGTFTIANGDQDYTSTILGNFLNFQGQSSGVATRVQVRSADDDGVDAVHLGVAFDDGEISKQLIMGWDGSDFVLQHFYAGANDENAEDINFGIKNVGLEMIKLSKVGAIIINEGQEPAGDFIVKTENIAGAFVIDAIADTAEFFVPLTVNDTIACTSIDTPTGRTATLVVAADDSATLSKNQADYVCDGTADEVQINAAFNALPAMGGTVFLPAGNYEVAASISIPSNGTLRGDGTATIIKLADSANTHIIVNGGTDNITIRNLILNGNGVNQHVDTKSNHTLELTNPVNAIVDNVHIINSRGYGLLVVNDDRGQYTNIVCTGPAAAGDTAGGINISAGNTYMAFCEAKDHLWDGVDASGRSYGIWVEGSDLTMVGCTASNNFNDGLVLRDTSDIRVYGGSFTDSTADKGAHISDAGGFNQDIVFYGTIFADNFKGGLTTDATTVNITFIGCDITGNGSTSSGSNYKGIDLRGTGHIFDNCHIDNNGNGAVDSGHGVSFATASSHMTFTNCTFNSNGDNGMLMAGDKHIVNNCTFATNDDSGLRILGGTPDSIKITNSTFFNNGDQGLDLRTVTNSIISENHFYDDQETKTQRHLYVSGGGEGVTIINNQFGLAEADAIVSGPEAAVPEYRSNSGYPTENGGKSGAIATGATIAHGLIATPTIMSVTPATSGVADLNIAVDATNITVTFTGGGSEEFFWEAKVNK